jgi:hypothetical protein
MNKNKFRFWNPHARGFVQNYRYRGLVDELFEQDDMLIPSQFTGILDKNMKEIYEGDVVSYKFLRYEHEVEESFGEVYFEDGCFMFDRSYMFCAVDANFRLESLEIIGNMYGDYMYDETGKLVKQFKL